MMMLTLSSKLREESEKFQIVSVFFGPFLRLIPYCKDYRTRIGSQNFVPAP
jgi:hypothetical protein